MIIPLLRATVQKRHRALILAVSVALTPKWAGCTKKPDVSPISIEQVPIVMQGAFKEAPAETRQIAEAAVAAVHNNDVSTAFTDLQELISRPELSSEQRAAAGRAFVALHEKLRAAAAKGDPKAAEILEDYRATK